MPLPALTVFDVETTGLDPKRGHRIIEIGAMRIEKGRLDETTTFSSLVNPERPIPPDAKRIHRITDDALRDAPTIMTVLPAFLAFAKDSLLVAHNAAFDRGFLDVEKECCWGYVDLPPCLCTVEKECCWGYVDLPPCLCTMLLSKSLFPTASRHNLDTLCERFHVPLPPDRHRALADVLLTAQVLLRLLEHGHIHSYEELQRRAGLPEMVKA
ncbi:3'-5' exonuclease [Candidatus Peregrinibacteria bacterium]|nr:3'-5' exonuclease [Candidatus Peregrinibacteria bacterium]